MNTVSIKDNESMNECLCETHVLRIINGKFYKNGKVSFFSNSEFVDWRRWFMDSKWKDYGCTETILW